MHNVRFSHGISCHVVAIFPAAPIPFRFFSPASANAWVFVYALIVSMSGYFVHIGSLRIVYAVNVI